MNDDPSGTFPAFILSIDVEMLWGPTNDNDISLLEPRMHKDREAVRTLITILEKYQISATWAVVGHLFEESCSQETCLTYKNKNKFGYNPVWYYDPYTDISRDPFYYGTDIINMIKESELRQDIGYHSYSHPLFTDICVEMAEAELKEAQKIRDKWKLDLDSFVFPQDKVSYIDLLPKYGFKMFRGAHYHARGRPWASSVKPKKRGDIWEIPSSAYFCNLHFQQMLNVSTRIGLRDAIKRREVFHIYLHPWSLLISERLANDLDKFLKNISSLRDKGKILVLTMHDYAQLLNDKSSWEEAWPH